MNLNELREVVKEVLQEQDFKWSDVLKTKPRKKSENQLNKYILMKI